MESWVLEPLRALQSIHWVLPLSLSLVLLRRTSEGSFTASGRLLAKASSSIIGRISHVNVCTPRLPPLRHCDEARGHCKGTAAAPCSGALGCCLSVLQGGGG